VRVIAGTLRGKILSGIQGNAVRPTSDKVRGAIFSTLLSRMETFSGARVLDMFAGSGALSIEALSRGAGQAVLFDSAPASQRLVARNLASCRLEGRAEVIRGDVFRHIDKAQRHAPFDIVFIDPPYAQGLASRALELVAGAGLLHEESWVVAEASRSEEIAPLIGMLHLTLERHYGSTTIRYYTLKSSPEG